MPVRRGRRTSKTLLAFLLGLLAGGLAAGLGAWILSGLVRGVPPDARAATVIGLVALGMARELGLVRFALPERSRQVPQSIFWSGSISPALRFGLELGTGVRTHITSTAPYLLLAGVVLLVDGAVLALTAGAAFGLGRAFMALSRAASRDADEWDARLYRRIGWLARACTGVCASALVFVSAAAL